MSWWPNISLIPLLLCVMTFHILSVQLFLSVPLGHDFNCWLLHLSQSWFDERPIELLLPSVKLIAPTDSLSEALCSADENNNKGDIRDAWHLGDRLSGSAVTLWHFFFSSVITFKWRASLSTLSRSGADGLVGSAEADLTWTTGRDIRDLLWSLHGGQC